MAVPDVSVLSDQLVSPWYIMTLKTSIRGPRNTMAGSMAIFIAAFSFVPFFLSSSVAYVNLRESTFTQQARTIVLVRYGP